MVGTAEERTLDPCVDQPVDRRTIRHAVAAVEDGGGSLNSVSRVAAAGPTQPERTLVRPNTPGLSCSWWIPGGHWWVSRPLLGSVSPVFGHPRAVHRDTGTLRTIGEDSCL